MRRLPELLIFLATVALTHGSPLRLMPLGDSITDGDAIHGSYRGKLWELLKDAGYEIDFVGSESGGRVFSLKDLRSDRDHEGHWGWRTDEVIAKLDRWLRLNPPDVVLIHLGSNDIFQGEKPDQIIGELSKVVAMIRQQKPQAIILIAKIIGSDAMPVETASLNRAIDQLAELDTPESPVRIVDQATGFDPAKDTYDGIHPTVAGAEKLAKTWFDALKEVLPAPAVK